MKRLPEAVELTHGLLLGRRAPEIEEELVEPPGRVDPVEGEEHPEEVDRRAHVIRGLSRDHGEHRRRRLIFRPDTLVRRRGRELQRQCAEAVPEHIERVHREGGALVEIRRAGILLEPFGDQGADPLRPEMEEAVIVGIRMARPSAAPARARRGDLALVGVLMRADLLRGAEVADIVINRPQAVRVFGICIDVLPELRVIDREPGTEGVPRRGGGRCRRGIREIFPLRDADRAGLRRFERAARHADIERTSGLRVKSRAVGFESKEIVHGSLHAVFSSL